MRRTVRDGCALAHAYQTGSAAAASFNANRFCRGGGAALLTLVAVLDPFVLLLSSDLVLPGLVVVCLEPVFV